MTPLERAILIVGGQATVARLLDQHPTTVWRWLNTATAHRKQGEPPGHLAVRISEMTGGVISPWDLRPDLFREPSA